MTPREADPPGLELILTEHPGVCVDEYGRYYRFDGNKFWPIDPPASEPDHPHNTTQGEHG